MALEAVVLNYFFNSNSGTKHFDNNENTFEQFLITGQMMLWLEDKDQAICLWERWGKNFKAFEILTLFGLTKDTKGQTKSKWFFRAYVSSKKQTNEFYFTTMKPQSDLFLFVFLEEIEDTKKTFRNYLTFSLVNVPRY